jgi:hypothetical protein
MFPPTQLDASAQAVLLAPLQVTFPAFTRKGKQLNKKNKKNGI